MPDEQAERTAAASRGRTEVDRYNERVWDMVLHLVHPVALYVILSVVLTSRFMGHEALAGRESFVFLPQFLGAWAVFYSTLLRDMGFPSRAGLILCSAAALVLTASFILAPEAPAASARTVEFLLGFAAVTAVLVWLPTLLRWRRLKRLCLAALEETGDGVA